MPAHTVADLNRLKSTEIPASRALPKLATCLIACGGIPTEALTANVVGDALDLLRALRRLLAGQGDLDRETVTAVGWLRPRFEELLDWEIETTTPRGPVREAACRSACEPYRRPDLEDGLIRNAINLCFWARRLLQAWTPGPRRLDEAAHFLSSLDSFFRAYPAIADSGSSH